jgi:outer membrane protein TolC
MLSACAPRAARRSRAVAAATFVGLATGCSSLAPGRFVSSGAPPPAQVAREAASSPAPPAPPAPAPPGPPVAPRSLADLVDLALSRDPATRATWFDARAAAARAGAARSLYLPAVEGGASIERRRSTTSAGGPVERTAYGVSGSLSWILLDLGGRAALVDEADRLLAAARLGEHAAVADLVLRVQQTYFQYLGARALLEAQASAVRQAETSLAAAEERRRAGVATIADALQARTALSQSRLELQRLEGQSLVLRGALATIAGLQPTSELEVGALPAEVRLTLTWPTVEALLSEATARNPELGQARAQAEAAAARARAASRAYYPALSLQAGGGRTWYLDPSGTAPQTTWNVGLALRFPLFEGLAPAYEALAARAAAGAALARADATAQGVALEVWTSYQALRTAASRVETSRDLLASATASAEVAEGRYREGVGSILDLLNAQAALENARAEEVRARADYLVSLAQLTRATGRLELPAPEPPAPPEGTP